MNMPLNPINRNKLSKGKTIVASNKNQGYWYRYDESFTGDKLQPLRMKSDRLTYFIHYLLKFEYFLRSSHSSADKLPSLSMSRPAISFFESS